MTSLLLALLIILVGGSAAILVLIKSSSMLMARIAQLPDAQRRRGVRAGVGVAVSIVLLVAAMIVIGPWALAAVGAVLGLAFIIMLPFIARSDIQRQRAVTKAERDGDRGEPLR